MFLSNGHRTNASKNSVMGRNMILANHRMIESDIMLQWFHLAQNANDDGSCIFSELYFKK